MVKELQLRKTKEKMVKELQLSKKPQKKNGLGTSIEQKTIDKMVYELQLSKNHSINGLGT